MDGGGRRSRRARAGAFALRRRARVLALALAVAPLGRGGRGGPLEPPRWVRHALGDAFSRARSARPARRRRCPRGGCSSRRRAGTWIVRGDGTRLRLGLWTGATGRRGSLRGRLARARLKRGGAERARGLDHRGARDRGATRRGRPTVTGSPIGATTCWRSSRVTARAPASSPGPYGRSRPAAPGAPHTLAWVAASGRVEVRDVDRAPSSGARGPPSARCARSAGRPTAIACSRAERRRVVVLDVRGAAGLARAPAAGGRGSTRRRGRPAATASRWPSASPRRRASTSRARRSSPAGRSSPPPGRCARSPGRRTPAASSSAGRRPTNGSCSPHDRQRPITAIAGTPPLGQLRRPCSLGAARR